VKSRLGKAATSSGVMGRQLPLRRGLPGSQIPTRFVDWHISWRTVTNASAARLGRKIKGSTESSKAAPRSCAVTPREFPLALMSVKDTM